MSTNNNLTELERLVAVETKLDTVIEQTSRMNDKLDLLLPTFVTHSQLTEKISSLESSLEEVKKSHKGKTIVRDILIMMLTSAVTFLLFFFLNTIS